MKTTKSSQDLANKYFFRKISKRLAALLLNKIEPITITILAFIVGFFAVFFILLNQLILAGIFILISHILDKTDGDLARLSNKESKRGDFLDDTSDRILDAFFIFSIAFISNNLFIGTLGIIAVFMTFIIGLSTKKPDETFTSVEQSTLKGIPSILILGRGIRNVLISLGLFFNQLFLLLLFFAIIQNIYWIAGAIFVYIKKKEEDKYNDN